MVDGRPATKVEKIISAVLVFLTLGTLISFFTHAPFGPLPALFATLSFGCLLVSVGFGLLGAVEPLKPGLWNSFSVQAILCTTGILLGWVANLVSL